MVPRNTTSHVSNSLIHIQRLLSCVLVVLTLAVSTLHAAETEQQTQAELENVTQAIADIQAWLHDASENYSNEQASLRAAELRLTTANNKVARIEDALTTTQTQRLQLQQEFAQLQTTKALQTTRLQQLLRAAYISGNQNLLKLLLNQEDPGKNARMLHYYRVYSESQAAALAQFQSTLDVMTTTGQALAATEQDLSRQQSELQQQLQELQASKQARQLALTELQASITSRNAELEQLQIDQAQLQQLVDEIRRAVESIPAPSTTTAFDTQRGQLPRPVAGKILRNFGSRYGDGNLRRQGITIATSAGTPVHAVHAGRVVFADWLRGTGLLIVLDHGDGYMSLYGNNEALAKAPGERVEAGDIIATSGHSADDQTSAVYFEIRRHGAPQNPADWLRPSDQ